MLYGDLPFAPKLEPSRPLCLSRSHRGAAVESQECGVQRNVIPGLRQVTSVQLRKDTWSQGKTGAENLNLELSRGDQNAL